MKVFSVHWKQAGKGGLDGFVIAEDEDSAFEKAMKYLSGEIKYTKDVLHQKYVWVKSSSMAYFIKEEYGWVVE